MNNTANDEILIVLPNGSLGGAEQVLKTISQYYLQNNKRLLLYLVDPLDSEKWIDLNGFEKFSIEKPSKKYPLLVCFILSIINLYRISRKQKITRIYTSHIHINTWISFLRQLNIIKTKFHIARESTNIFKRFQGIKLSIFKLFYNFGYQRINLVVCQTNEMKNELDKNIPYLSIKTKVINNPIDLQSIKVLQNEIVPTYTNLEYFVAAGRLIPEKGFDVLIQSFAKLNSNNRFQLLILGEGPDRDKLENLISLLSLGKSVILPGFVSNVYPYFKQAKCCVVSSRVEGFPNVLLQMMSQNKLVISTLCADGIAELTDIITCKPDDEEELLIALQKSIKNESVERNPKTNLQQRNIEKFISKIDEFLEIKH